VPALPLRYSTGSATQVITATAPSLGSTSGTLQAWQRVSGGWTRVGAPVTAWFGSQGLTEHMSEFVSATPVGSYTLTQAFGSQPNPGTGLPYFRTTPADWWISKTTAPDNTLYNTHQRCSTNCPFDTSDSRTNTNEHLYYAQPYYRYAVVIDYNTTNAPGGVVQKAGSAVFLHVTDYSPTAGCVAVNESRLIALMQWLEPAAHPRILIGVA
jgi:L,D-peptidoglycan transpeptidase YkuD (ErfK/YbiS/YcfS/YnhG family)